MVISVIMVNSCCVVGCKRRGTEGFYLIPAVRTTQGVQTEELSRKRREAWIVSIHREGWTPTTSSRVCSIHFTSG